MAAPRYLPSDSVLEQWRAEGLTLNQMVERVKRETGHTVARSTVAAALSRAGLTNRIRYEDQVPWKRIRTDHNHAYPLTMLRHLARRENGLPLTEEQSARLDSWLQRLADEGAVVTYKYDSPDGFYYVPRKPSDGDGVVRRPPRRRSTGG